MVRGNLTANDKQVLKLIASGHDTLCNIADFMGWIIPDAVIELDRLELEGYIRRNAAAGNDYLRFALTDKGYQTIEELPEQEKELIYKHGISKEDLEVLKAAYELGPSQSTNDRLSEKTGYQGMQVVSCVENLERKGYVRQVGWVRRRLVLTPSGEKLVKAG